MATRRENLNLRANNLRDLVISNSGNLYFRESTYSSNSPYDHGPELDDKQIYELAREKGGYSDEIRGNESYATFVQVLRGEVSRRRKQLVNIYRNSDKLQPPPISATAKKPVAGKVGENVWRDNRSYDAEFGRVEGFPGDDPSRATITEAARSGFNLGQVLGPDFKNTAAVERQSVFDVFSGIIKGIERGTHNFSDYASFLSDPRNQEAIAKYYDPKFIRPQNPIPERSSLQARLQQNLLLDRGQGGNIEVFNQLYVENRGAQGTGLFEEGLIGGVPVKSIQEPDSRGKKVFRFTDDRENYSTDKQDRGISSNIDKNSNKLNPAVVNFERPSNSPGVSDELLTYAGLVESQFFPFMFETENKGDAKQYAFFQAALQSLQEAYQPTWTSKSFIGRTEKIHTYTETDRSIDISFVIFAEEARQLQNVYERINWLAQQTYGEQEVDSTGAVTRTKSGPLLRFTIGDIFQRVPGYIRNLTYNWDFAGPGGGRWEITRGLRMPQMCQVQCSIAVIHQALPDRDFNFYWGLERGVRIGNGDGRGNLIPVTLSESGETTSQGTRRNYIDRLNDRG